MEALRREKVAAERRAALATAEKAESVRAAAEKLQDAHRRNEDLAHVRNHPCLLCNYASHEALPEGSEEVRTTAIVWHPAA